MKTVIDWGKWETLLLWGGLSLISVGVGFYVVLLPTLPQPLGALSLLVVVGVFVLLMVDVRHLLLAVIFFDVPLQLDAYLFYREPLAKLGAIGGFGYSVTTLALIALYALWLIEWLAQSAHQDPFASRPQMDGLTRLWKLTLPLLTYVGFVALSGLVATDQALVVFELNQLVQLLFLFVYIVAKVRTKAALTWPILFVLAALLLESVVMVGLRGIGHTIQLGPILARVEEMRVGGTIGGPNTAAGYLSLLLAVATAVIWAKLPMWQKGLAWLALGFGIIALTLTQSRGGILALFVSMLVAIAVAWRRGWVSFRLIVCAVGILVALLSVFQSQLLASRLLGGDAGAAKDRLPLLLLALRMFWEHPWLGVGANNFSLRVIEYVTPEFDLDWLYVVHNKYVLILTELGVGGLIAFLWFLAAILWRAWRVLQGGDPLLAPLALGISAGILGHLVHMNVDLFNQRQLVQMLWIQAGLLTAIYCIHCDGSHE